MNDLLITKLKMARLNAKLTQDEVSQQLGIKPNTLSNWETGRTQPDIDAFVELCRIYNIDCGSLLADVYAFDKVKSSISLNEFEHIQRWRLLDEESRTFVSSILEREIRAAETIKGMEDEIVNMKHSPKNIIEIGNSRKGRYCIPYYNKIASAGRAIDSLSDMIGGIMEIDDTPENRKGNYAIGVLGDSMEPTYYDGDIVLVKNTDRLQTGDVGIFQKDNGVYIKEVGDDGLISHNPDYAPIKEDTIIKIMGKVLKKIDASEGEVIS